MTFPMSGPSQSRPSSTACCAPGTTCAPERGVHQLFDELFGAQARAEFAPAVDLSETQDALLVSMEVPGVEPKDISVSFERNVLTVSGEKKATELADGDRYHRVECRYGRFARQIEFRTPVDGDRVEATFKNGVLTVRLPKHEKARSRTIDVKHAE